MPRKFSIIFTTLSPIHCQPLPQITIFYPTSLHPGVTSYVNDPLVLSRLFAFFAVVAAINVLLIECLGKKKVILGFLDENTVPTLNSNNSFLCCKTT